VVDGVEFYISDFVFAASLEKIVERIEHRVMRIEKILCMIFM
jgi:hypothetical protein